MFNLGSWNFVTMVAWQRVKKQLKSFRAPGKEIKKTYARAAALKHYRNKKIRGAYTSVSY